MLQPSRKTNIMRYNGGELAAIVKMAISMAAADGYFADEEKEAIFHELANFGVTPEQAAHLLIRAKEMDASEAFSILSAMGTEQKKYVTGFLAVIMASDGDIDESEVKMWQLISVLAKLPDMTFPEALAFWNNN